MEPNNWPMKIPPVVQEIADANKIWWPTPELAFFVLTLLITEQTESHKVDTANHHKVKITKTLFPKAVKKETKLVYDNNNNDKKWVYQNWIKFEIKIKIEWNKRVRGVTVKIIQPYTFFIKIT